MCSSDLRKFRRSFFRTLVFRLTRAKMVVISRTLQTIASAEWHIRERQLVYIPNGVSVDHCQTGIASKTLKKTGLVVGTVCGLRPEKRVDRIVDAFALLTDQFPDLELWIVGEGSERKRLELLVESKSLTHKVQFIGHLSEPFGVMRQFDVFCLTSDTEQAPLSLLEAMALGLPCVATSVGDVPNMVSKENKPFLCQLSAQSVASALEAMLQDRNAMQLIGMANRAAYLDQFQFAESSSKWMKVFSEK